MTPTTILYHRYAMEAYCDPLKTAYPFHAYITGRHIMNIRNILQIKYETNQAYYGSQKQTTLLSRTYTIYDYYYHWKTSDEQQASSKSNAFNVPHIYGFSIQYQQG